MREVESLPGSQRLKAEPLYQSLRSTIRHYLGGHLHQFLLAYGEGLLPRQVEELPCRAYVLNMPCGSGDWVCDMAYDHPLMEFVGVDPDPRRVAFAQSQADVQGFINTAFLAGAPGGIAPPDHSYDLVHIRFLAPLVSPYRWSELAAEWWKFCRPGGMLVWLEMQAPATSSPACTLWCNLLRRAVEQEGGTFDITSQMPCILKGASFQQVQQTVTSIDISYGTRLHQQMGLHAWDTLNFVQHFLLSMQIAPPVYLHDLYERMIQDIQSANFTGTWPFVTTIAVKERTEGHRRQLQGRPSSL